MTGAFRFGNKRTEKQFRLQAVWVALPGMVKVLLKGTPLCAWVLECLSVSWCSPEGCDNLLQPESMCCFVTGLQCSLWLVHNSHKVHKWHQDIPGCTSVIDFMVTVSRRAQLVTTWWWIRFPIDKVYWECLTEEPLRKIYNSKLQQNIKLVHILQICRTSPKLHAVKVGWWLSP